MTNENKLATDAVKSRLLVERYMKKKIKVGAYAQDTIAMAAKRKSASQRN